MLGLWNDHIRLKELIVFLFLLSGTKERISLTSLDLSTPLDFFCSGILFTFSSGLLVMLLISFLLVN